MYGVIEVIMGCDTWEMRRSRSTSRPAGSLFSGGEALSLQVRYIFPALYSRL